MGKKSDKKSKSERINALRKQYDAFLEEDKKRKERNQFILGKLDNMRYNSSAAQIRHKAIMYGELYPANNRMTYRSEKFGQHEVHTTPPTQQLARPSYNHDLQVDIPRKYIDDTTLLKEISKKYILIPKLRPSLSNDYGESVSPQSFPPMNNSYESSASKININNNDDWKSKYDILEQLKNEKIEKQACGYGKDELLPVKEKQTIITNKSKKDNDEYSLQSHKTEEFSTKYETEIPEKDLSSELFKVENELHNIEKPKISETKDQEPNLEYPQTISTAPIYAEPHSINEYTSQNTTVTEYNTKDTENYLDTGNAVDNLEQYTPHGTLMTAENETEDVNSDNQNKSDENLQQNEYQQQEYPNQEEYPTEFEAPIVSEGKYPDHENVYLDENDYSPIQVVHPDELVENIQREEPTAINEAQESEGTENPMEMLNVQEFTPNEDVHLQDGVNINPIFNSSEGNGEPSYAESPQLKATENEKHLDNVPYNSGIEAFDAEQREMFYSEETSDYVYDQQTAIDNYNQEHDQSETYAPNQENMEYYQGAEGLQEQAYPVEINDYEETSAPYDQSYEEQYAPQYVEHTQEQQQYQEPIQGYEESEPVEQQYERYEYEQPDGETVHTIEQTLDNEQGFVAKPNMANEVDNADSFQMHSEKSAE